jgi:uncharacterized protein involved in type VI secretion and phage assembly
MSAHKFINNMRMWANMATQGSLFTALGNITAFDPTGYQVQVILQEATNDAPALQTGWIPLATPWAGNGWGMFCPASPGDLILVFFQDGSLQNPIAGMRLFFDGALPLNVPAGEMWLVHKTGSALKLTNDGGITIQGTADINIASDTKINLTAPEINITGATIKAGDTGGSFDYLKKADGSNTANLQGS